MAGLPIGRTVGLFHFDGTNGAQPVTTPDEVDSQTFTSTTVLLSTAQSRFGVSSLRCLGGINHYAANTSLLAEGLRLLPNYTSELWFRADAIGTLQGILFMGGITVNTNVTSLYLTAGGNIRLVLVTAGGTFDGTGSTTLSADTWYHVAIVQRLRTVFVYVDGVLEVTLEYTGATHTSAGTVYLGVARLSSVNSFLIGYIDEFRIVSDAVYTAAFTPPSAALDIITPEATNVSIYRYPGTLSFGGPGRGTISGTTKVTGTPDTPVQRRVRLITKHNPRVIAEVWSDPVTGAYEFTDLPTNGDYAVIAYDHTGTYNGVVATDVTPT